MFTNASRKNHRGPHPGHPDTSRRLISRTDAVPFLEQNFGDLLALATETHHVPGGRFSMASEKGVILMGVKNGGWMVF